MPNIDHQGLKRNITHQGTWGNLVAEHRSINSDPDIADVLRFMKVPGGTKVFDAKVIHDAMGTGVTCSVGYTPVDGSAAVPAAIMAAGQDIAAAGVKLMTKVPFVIPVESYITLTTAGANADGLDDIDLTLEYVFQGNS